MIPVLFIAYYFPPAGGAGVQRSQKFVRYLPEEGFQPIVVTGPGPSGDVWSPRDATLAAELSNGIRVQRAAGPIPKSGSGWSGRMNRWFGTGDPFANWWIESAYRAALPVVNETKLIFATMSPFPTTEVAQKLSDYAGIPWVADLRDPWALDEMMIYPSGLHRVADMRRMQRGLSGATAIIMNTPESTAVLQDAFPEFRRKLVATITNGYDAPDFECEIPARTDKKFRIVHTGYLHTQGGLELRRKQKLYRFLGGIEGDIDILTRSHVILLQAVKQWVNSRAELENDLELVLAGVTSESDKAAVMNSSVARFIQLPGYLSHKDSVTLVRTADLLFLPMHNLKAGRRSRIVPGKTYEYIASMRPILAAVPEGDAREFLKAAGTASIVAPDDVGGMIRALDERYSAWKAGVTGKVPDQQFIQRFNRVNLTKELATVFRKVLESTSA